MEKENVAAIHIEDQVDLKRCGHRPNKKLISIEKMKDRINAALDARSDQSFVIMVRSDALAVENENKLIERIQSYIEIGADMIFPEAITSLDQYKKIADFSSVPVLANITEFGKTPLFSKMDLHKAGISTVVLEEHNIGWGASSRNGGMATPGLKQDIFKIYKKYGMEYAREFWKASVDAIDLLENIIQEEEINCDWSRKGHIALACKQSHYDKLPEYSDWISRELGHKKTLVPKEEIQSEIVLSKLNSCLWT